MKSCSDCTYADWDCDIYYGGAKDWFWVGCGKGHDDPEEDCPDWKESGAE